MPNRKGLCALLLALVFTLAATAEASAQEADAPRQAPPRPEVNHEVYIHLLATGAGAEGGARVPPSLEGVVRQLKSALPASDYGLAATFIHRVRDGGGFEVKTTSDTALGPAQTPARSRPVTFQLSVAGVKLIDPASAQPSVNVQHFRLGMKLPIQTVNLANDKGEGGFPVVHYEDVGVNTQVSVREGEPTLVGTLDSGRPGRLFVIVLTIRRAGK